MLRANDGRIMKTFANSRRINASLKAESGLSGPDAVITTSRPVIPKDIDAIINTRVAIFCIPSVYQKNRLRRLFGYIIRLAAERRSREVNVSMKLASTGSTTLRK